MKFNGLFPIPDGDGPCWAITTSEGSVRDAGGCVSPGLEGLLLQKVGGDYLLSTFEFSTSREWNSRDVWYVTSGTYGKPEVFHGSPPAFVWRKSQSGYHFEFASAKANIEVVPSPTPEWLFGEMRSLFPEFDCSDAVLRAFLENMMELPQGPNPEECSKESSSMWQESIWDQRSRMDVRARLLKFMGERGWKVSHLLREFNDSRGPYVYESQDPDLKGAWVLESGEERVVLSPRQALSLKAALNRIHDSKLRHC